MSGEERKLELIMRSPTEEVLTKERLAEYIASGTKLNHYIGFEISGMVHLGTGIVCMEKVADLQEAGVSTRIFLADYHSFINNKLGGDLETIRRVALGYFKEALLQSLKCVGGDPEKTKVVLATDLYNEKGIEYFEDVLKVSKGISMGRAKRSVTILGRKMGEELNLAQLIYVPMQVADIYIQGVNIAHAGIDQRKAHVVAIEAAKSFSYTPVALHHHLLMGISMSEEQRLRMLEAEKEGNRDKLDDSIIDIKMSKSKPNSAIFIHDTEEEIKAKISKALCPPKELEVNPVIDLMRYIIGPIMEKKKAQFEIKNAKTGRSDSFPTIKELEEAYAKGLIHPMDLKLMVAEELTKLLEPARKYFLSGPGSKYLEEMKSLIVTR
ncbi:MAG: tyrosine--tRNA ligase [Candidatus Micrarchaeia archaeon]|jgi:tyrosyl-tRNA synthetase